MNDTGRYPIRSLCLFTILTTVLFALSACGSATGLNTGFRSGASARLAPESKLALGTVKLEGTPRAVDVKMATDLLPLWQLLFQLDSSSSTAPQEVTAVLDQIHRTMTPEQVTAIDAMTLSQADIFSTFQQESATGSTGANTGPSLAPGNRTNRGFVVIEGGPAGGGPGSGAVNNFSGGGFRDRAGAAAGSGSEAGSPLNGAQALAAREKAISSLLINQVIRLLESKVGR